MSEREIPDDIREWAEQLGIRLRFSLAGINRAAATVWATDGAIARVNDAFAEAILAERQKHDLPTSPDIQAEAERVFADVQRAVLVEDAKQVIANALRARDERAAQICEEQRQVFLSPQYATGQPFSSFAERLGCTRCAEAIRAEA